MKLLITGICGFVGSTLARALQEQCPRGESLQIFGVDNFSRPGSERNRLDLRARGISIQHADLRVATDVDRLPQFDWVLDAAANPSVLAGIDGKTSSREILDHNLYSTINLLEACKRYKAGFILLSTSRVYSIPGLVGLPMQVREGAFHLDSTAPLPRGVSARGIQEQFSTESPVSLYGASKVASELLALEYGACFSLPIWINRCGVLAGAGQFGRPDQGIVSYWIHSWLRKRPLKYIGFGGTGHQSRDAFHPRDLVPLLQKQIASVGSAPERVFNLGGGLDNTFSLLQLSSWCEQRFGRHEVAADHTPRSFDIPWMTMDFTKAREFWGWKPHTSLMALFEELAQHAEANPNWLEISADR
ncbi:MAG TPA: NAD-dependent epimerase/dehydratase family protein [Verrucomicrobiae bacterium]|nr:NAD-dependent epimerase/dehydratase family protein [Verrucomicrobiae bacterium]